ncbi:Protein CBG25161 [Caenorhabditis briggsae]|uniref:Protein CBG25161 n=1 Tax=Caenorhabditis briggsae TaxID=6238 RepID=B6IID4_CAEBR|nr:Protein CBG25161 [Caenorhabditis briggsae]CAR99664.1 Protein CBG25161 [Caenorhabditis briggsae]
MDNLSSEKGEYENWFHSASFLNF